MIMFQNFENGKNHCREKERIKLVVSLNVIRKGKEKWSTQIGLLKIKYMNSKN